jgi:hypothetical protein
MGDMYSSAAKAEIDRARQKGLRSTRVELEPVVGLSEQGQRFRVMHASDTLVEGRRNQIFDACRALLARGITGRLEVWRPGKTSVALQLDIERGACLAIKETATESLRIVTREPWHPNPDDRAGGPVSYRRTEGKVWARSEARATQGYHIATAPGVRNFTQGFAKVLQPATAGFNARNVHSNAQARATRPTYRCVRDVT